MKRRDTGEIAIPRRARSLSIVLALATACSHSASSPHDAATRTDARTLPDGATAPDAATDATVADDVATSPCPEGSAETEVLALRAEHHDGQTFLSWADRAQGSDGAHLRYRVFRSAAPITDASLAEAEQVAEVFNHSGQRFGTAFRPDQRLDDSKPMALVREGGEPLVPWSGLAVSTATEDGCGYFAVLAVDGDSVEGVDPGFNATTSPIRERRAETSPILLESSDERPGPYVAQTRITGRAELPLVVQLHASNATGGGAGDYGDLYAYFGDRSMGYQDGTPGVFSVEERTDLGFRTLMMRNRDTIVHPNGSRGVETHWFGYVTEHDRLPRHAYPFTERRLDWSIAFARARYEADPARVYLVGQSMGAWGAMTYGYRRPEGFAAIHASLPRFRQRSMAVLASTLDDAVLPSGEPWEEHHDSIAFAERHASTTLPFLAWNIGRRDGFATWQEQLDMVRVLTETRQGFAFAWNDGDHSEGVSAAARVRADYPLDRFSRTSSFPAFSHSSIDDELGNGDPTDGDLEGGINLGFSWSDPEETETTWSVRVSNHRCEAPMTVEVTPRRAQRFRPSPGTRLHYTSSRGEAGDVVVDPDGLVTARISIAPGSETMLVFMPR